MDDFSTEIPATWDNSVFNLLLNYFHFFKGIVAQYVRGVLVRRVKVEDTYWSAGGWKWKTPTGLQEWKKDTYSTGLEEWKEDTYWSGGGKGRHLLVWRSERMTPTGLQEWK